MVLSCTVCMNNSRKKDDISYFCYPKDSVRRREWLTATGREDLLLKLDDAKTRQQYRVCEDHFEKSYITVNKIRKILHTNAIPTLNLPTNDKMCLSSSQCENISTQTTNSSFNKIEILNDQSSHSSLTEVEKYNSESRTLHLSADAPSKRKLAIELPDGKNHKKCDLDSLTKEDFLKLCDKFMTESMAQIIKWQIDLKPGSGGNQYSLAFKFFALNLYFSGPGAYRFLTKTFCLPSLVTLQTLVRPIGTKLDERLLNVLKTKVDKMGSQERICSVCVDCISLKPNLFYDVKNDRIVGFHETNGIQKIVPAKYVIVIMIRGIVHNYKQPIAHAFLSQCNNYPEINNWIDKIIASLLNIGLDIRVFISELGSELLSASLSRSVSRDKTYFEINGQKIYYMFDVPHVVKCVRDHLKTCDFLHDNRVAKWTHIRDLYNEDKNQQIRLAPKLTDIHINPNDFQKMRVIVATQVLSSTVASAMNTYVDLNIMDSDAKDTAYFINKINNLFDILNSCTLRSPNKYKRAFRGKSWQIEFLNEMLTFFNNLKLIKIEGQVDITNIMNFIHGFQVSIKSVLQLYEDFKAGDIKFLFTKRLNLDCLKDFFSKVRQADRNCQQPTCRQVSVTFNKMFITNILKRLNTTNCDQDFDSMLKKTDDYRMFSTPSQNSQVSFPDETVSMLTVGTSDYRFDLPEKNCILFISVYLYRKCYEQHKCSAQSGSSFLTIPPNNFIAFVKLLEHIFREYFDLDTNIVNVGNNMFKRVNECKFDMLCECFPLDYLKKLFIRLMIYHSIKRYNKLLKNENDVNKIFSLSYL